MRRTPKPFAVEVRRGGRTVKSSTASSSPVADLILETEQPRVNAWPGVDQSPQPHTPEQRAAAIAPARRVLPVLAETAPPVAEVEPEEQPTPSSRRHWPAIPGLTIESTWPEDDGAAEELAMVTGQIEPEPEPEESEVDVEQPAAAAIADAGTIAAAMLLRQGRRPRDAFRREERWKSRLPAVMHRAR